MSASQEQISIPTVNPFINRKNYLEAVDVLENQNVTSETLEQIWTIIKQAESATNSLRLAVEKRLVELNGDLATGGTKKLSTIKYTVTVSRTWDEEIVKQFYEAHGEEIPKDSWPFEWVSTLKNDWRKTQKLQEQMPHLWDGLASALTTKPRKPSFSIIEQK